MKNGSRPRHLFTPVVQPEMLHPSFREMMDGPERQGARVLMQRTFDEWDGSDNQFVRDFQTSGFDARVWELYLTATLKELGWAVGNEANRPDFKCQRDGCVVFVEAGTANESYNPPPPESTQEYFRRLRLSTDNRDEVAVRFGSAIRSKIQKNYQDLPHVSGRPIVIAVQGFFGPGAMLHNEIPLIRYLYDLALTHTNRYGEVGLMDGTAGHHFGDSKTISSGLFGEDDSQHVSAVIWSNSGTVGKFNRRAAIDGFGSRDWEIHRFGTELNESSGATERANFIERVGSRDEPWEEGLVLMHNPRAKHPLDNSAFPELTQIRAHGHGLSVQLKGRKIFSQRSMPHRIANRSDALQRIESLLDAGIEAANR